MSASTRWVRFLALGFAGSIFTLLTGCAQLKMGAPVPSIDNIQKAKSVGMAPVALGSFSLATGKPQAMDLSVSARSNTIFSPFDSSFAKYLKENLSVDLRAAGLLDPGSSIVVEGRLTDNRLDASIGQASATVAARFSVTKAAERVYDKELRANATWDSPFVGAVALPAAMNEYSLLYRKLVSALLGDPEFIRAASK